MSDVLPDQPPLPVGTATKPATAAVAPAGNKRTSVANTPKQSHSRAISETRNDSGLGGGGGGGGPKQIREDSAGSGAAGGAGPSRLVTAKAGSSRSESAESRKVSGSRGVGRASGVRGSRVGGAKLSVTRPGSQPDGVAAAGGSGMVSAGGVGSGKMTADGSQGVVGTPAVPEIPKTPLAVTTSAGTAAVHEHEPEPSRKLELGVMKRTPMGDYIPDNGVPLSSLANPTPGPLDYDPKLPPSGFQYSILGKHAQLKNSNTGPGPKYNIRPVDVVFDESPHWSFGVKVGDVGEVKNTNPSPFAYNNKVGSFGMDSLSYTISGRNPVLESETPGPDRYFPKESSHPVAGASPKWSFGLKVKEFKDPSPGPQDYDVKWNLPSAETAPSYTMRPRVGEPVFTDKEDLYRPGYNEYTPKLQWSEKAASLKGWYKESKAMKTPGPANYIMPNTLFSGPQYTLPARELPYEDEEYYVPPPGPADYNPNAGPTLDKAPQYSLGNRWRSEKLKDEMPGPGAYEPKDRQIRGNDGPKITLKSRRGTKMGTFYWCQRKRSLKTDIVTSREHTRPR
ncbi:hypothetical protein HK101_010075 [Irineochytrium annulatum]|nr:hypothetical protein HK101_010075 [Irineochytrium annulatum]